MFTSVLFPRRLLACVCPLAPAILAVIISGPAHGAAFQLPENTAAGLGTSFAGAGSAAATPDTVFNNPAGMVRLPGLQVYVGGTLIVPSFTFKGTARNAFDAPVTGETERDGGVPALLPFGYVTYSITPDISVGLGVTAPFGLSTYYGPGWAGRYVADKTDLRTIDFNPAVAYRVAPWFSIGAGISVQKARAVLSSVVNSRTLAFSATGQLLPLPDGEFNLQGNDVAVGYNFGVLLEPRAGTRIGLTYRSRIQHNFDGQVTFDVPAPFSTSPAFRNGPMRSKVVLPDTATISLTQEFGMQWSAYLDVTWTDWFQFKTLSAFRDTGELITSTPQNYRYSSSFALGASYQPTGRLTLRAGMAYEKTPVQDTFRNGRIPDQDHYWLSIGASYQMSASTAVDAGYAHLFVPDARVADRSSTGDVLQGRFTGIGGNVLAAGMRFNF
jgi:long-chain fatty acid transport protein